MAQGEGESKAARHERIKGAGNPWELLEVILSGADMGAGHTYPFDVLNACEEISTPSGPWRKLYREAVGESELFELNQSSGVVELVGGGFGGA